MRTSTTGKNSQTGRADEFFGAGRTSDIKLAGLLFEFGGLLAILLVILAEAAYPNYSIHANALSDLSGLRAPTFVIGETAGLLRAIPWIFGAYFLLRSTGRKRLMALGHSSGSHEPIRCDLTRRCQCHRSFARRSNHLRHWVNRSLLELQGYPQPISILLASARSHQFCWSDGRAYGTHCQRGSRINYLGRVPLVHAKLPYSELYFVIRAINTALSPTGGNIAPLPAS